MKSSSSWPDRLWFWNPTKKRDTNVTVRLVGSDDADKQPVNVKVTTHKRKKLDKEISDDISFLSRPWNWIQTSFYDTTRVQRRRPFGIDPWPPLLKIKVYDVAFHHHRWSFTTYHANRTTCTFDEIVGNDYSRLRVPCLNIWYFIGRVGNDQLSTCVSDECSDLNVWLSEIKKYFVIDKNERSEEENKTSNERKNSWERRSARGKGQQKIAQKVNFYLWKCFGWVMCDW